MICKFGGCAKDCLAEKSAGARSFDKPRSRLCELGKKPIGVLKLAAADKIGNPLASYPEQAQPALYWGIPIRESRFHHRAPFGEIPGHRVVRAVAGGPKREGGHAVDNRLYKGIL